MADLVRKLAPTDIESARSQVGNTSGFAVIVAGFPRTGTFSMRTALGTLLNGACYHGYNWFGTGAEVEMTQWERAFEGTLSKEDWINFFQKRGFRAAADFPANLFYK